MNGRMALWRCGLPLVMAALSGPVIAADPSAADSPFAGIPNIRFEYYDVEGITAADIYASMRVRAPKGANADGVAKTEWHLRVGWREAKRGGECDVADPLASLSLRVILPRLVNEDAVSPAGLAFWRAAIAGLEIHEAGHARIAWDHRNDFSRAARGATCKTIRKIATQTEDRIKALQDDYDRVTRHGITQTPPIER